MIERYSRKKLTDIWSEENKYQIWLDVEVAAAEAMEKMGQIPKGVASIVRKNAKINVKQNQTAKSISERACCPQSHRRRHTFRKQKTGRPRQ